MANSGIDLEISALTPLRLITDINGIKIGTLQGHAFEVASTGGPIGPEIPGLGGGRCEEENRHP